MNVVKVKRFCLIAIFLVILGCFVGQSFNLPKLVGSFRLIGYFVFTFGITIIALRLSLKADSNKKLMLILFGISFFLESVNFLIYNMKYSIRIINPMWGSNFFDIPWFFALLLQVTSLWIIGSTDQLQQISKTSKIQFPFIVSALFITLIFIFCLSWKIDFSIPSGTFMFMITLLQAFCFALVSSYLVTIRNEAFTYIAVGFLVIIATDYSMRVHQVENLNYLNTGLDYIWIIGSAILFCGFALLNPKDLQNNSETWFYQTNSIQSKVALWNIILCLLSILIFTILISIVIWPHHAVYDTIKYLPSILIPLTTITILISTQFSKKLLLPLNHIQETIKNFFNDSSIKYVDRKDHGILEYIELNNFLNKSFTLAEEKLNAEKKLSDLAVNVAHDIRSPLSTIEMIVSTLNDKIPEGHQNVLLQAAQNVREIANNLLIRYRDPIDESNKFNLPNGENVEAILLLSSTIESTIDQKRHEWSLNPCKVTVVISQEAKSCEITAVPNDLKRILSNLLNNAYEALQTRREIYLNLVLIENHLHLTIEDSGVGISNELINNILNGMSLKHSGKGLGLSGAKKYMESINGRLVFSSIEASGSKVTLIFPITAK